MLSKKKFSSFSRLEKTTLFLVCSREENHHFPRGKHLVKTANNFSAKSDLLM